MFGICKRNDISILAVAEVGEVIMTLIQDAEYYRQKAEEMSAQAQRAQSPHMRLVYEGMATNWLRLAETLGDATTRPTPKDGRAPNFDDAGR